MLCTFAFLSACGKDVQGAPQMSPSEMKEFIREVFTNVMENMQATEETYAKYFSKDYVQYVDGKTLNYNQFVAHMKKQKEVFKSAKITFKYIIVEGDKIATIHVGNAVKKDGGIVEAQLNAVFQVKDGKLVLCDELSHLIKGEKSDSDLGSCQ